MVSIDFKTINSCMERAAKGWKQFSHTFQPYYVTKPSKVIYSIAFVLAAKNHPNSRQVPAVASARIQTISNSGAMVRASSKHESLQMKMGKIALGVHKKSPNMAVRGELGMFPLTIDIYVRIVNYFFHLLELAGEGNTIIQSGVAECITVPLLTTIIHAG